MFEKLNIKNIDKKPLNLKKLPDSIIEELSNIAKENKKENLIKTPSLETRISALEEAITDIILSQTEV